LEIPTPIHISEVPTQTITIDFNLAMVTTVEATLNMREDTNVGVEDHKIMDEAMVVVQALEIVRILSLIIFWLIKPNGVNC
jgi:hypothetical protein